MVWVVSAYIAAILLIAYFSARKETLSGYFANNNSSSLPFLIASNASTFVGAGALMFAGEAYRSGISVGIIQLSWALLGCLVFVFFAPKIKSALDAHGVFTLPDFFGARYGESPRLGMALTQVVLLISWAATQIVGISKLLSMFFGISYEFALIASALVIVLYTSSGGLKTDILTDFIQFWVMLVGLGLLLYFTVSAAGGIPKIFASLPKGHLDPFAFAPPATIIIGSFMTAFFSLSNSGHWQRIASSKNLAIVGPSYIWTTPFCVFFVVAATLIGLAATSYVHNLQDPDALLFVLGRDHVPVWAGGLVIAAILATIMSTVDSLLIALSTVVLKQAERLHKPLRFNLLQTRLSTGLIGVVIFALALLFPTIIGLSLFCYNMGLALIPATLGALYNRPRKNVTRSLFYGVGMTLVFYYFLGKSTFLLSLVFATGVLFWPFKQGPKAKMPEA